MQRYADIRFNPWSTETKANGQKNYDPNFMRVPMGDYNPSFAAFCIAHLEKNKDNAIDVQGSIGEREGSEILIDEIRKTQNLVTHFDFVIYDDPTITEKNVDMTAFQGNFYKPPTSHHDIIFMYRFYEMAKHLNISDTDQIVLQKQAMVKFYKERFNSITVREMQHAEGMPCFQGVINGNLMMPYYVQQQVGSLLSPLN